MSVYPATETEQRIDFHLLREFVSGIFGRCGMAVDDAALLADTMVSADLRGCHSHGVLRVPEYVVKLRERGVDPRGQPRVVSQRAAAIVVDGGNSMGQIGSAFAMNRAIEAARETSVAMAVVRGSNHCGAMAHFAMMALPEDMIGMAATNALPTMAPWGGTDKILGINPLAVAIPAASEYPIVFDAAFSASSHGKIRVYHQKGLAIPPGWAFTREGVPTTDAAEAIQGLLQPIGGYKGTGLAIIMGILSSLLSGAAYGTETGNMIDGAKPGADGHFFVAVNIAAFEDPARFKQRVDGLIREIHASALAPGFDCVYAPGELEEVTRERYLSEGIPLNSHTLEDLRRTAQSLGLDAMPLQKAL